MTTTPPSSKPEVKPELGQERRQGVAEPMPPGGVELGQPLRPRRPDVVLVELLEEGRPRQPRVVGGQAERQRQGRKEQVAEVPRFVRPIGKIFTFQRSAGWNARK